jgi:hypothetical protein
MTYDATAAYLTSRLDQLGAAQRDDDTTAADEVVGQLIRDDHLGARALIADALRRPVTTDQPREQ